ncbi:hypothetical protein BT93_A0600 [Corymbia citriodora subsp. variegata]|nr:hypothetical protein BT93_A0600 [Corymbia citriodora subsp. variegata]
MKCESRFVIASLRCFCMKCRSRSRVISADSIDFSRFGSLWLLIVFFGYVILLLRIVFFSSCLWVLERSRWGCMKGAFLARVHLLSFRGFEAKAPEAAVEGGEIWRVQSKRRCRKTCARRDISNASKAVKQGPSAGKAAIGGPFNLINDEGKNVTEKDFLGRWTLIYFGFTHCPDICPDELQKLAAAVDKIKEKAGFNIVPVFISVDPERDTVEQVHEYVKEFHPNLIGLTGTPEEIKKVARAYRVYYMKTAEEDSDYLVDHSIVMYLMGPDMDFVKFFGKNNDVDALTDGVINEIKQYKNQK